MDIAPCWQGLVDIAQEFHELLGTMARQAFPDDHARHHIQRGRSVPFVIVGHGLRAARLQRQSRLRAIERLDSRFLIDAQHDGPVRRVEVKPDDIVDLFLEQAIAPTSAACTTVLTAQATAPIFS